MSQASDPHRRVRILEAATALLCHYGVSKTTVSDIAREAGVGVGTVYLEFPSKKKIIEALALGRHDQVLGAMEQAITEAFNPKAKLEAALKARTAALLRLGERGTHSAELLYGCCEAAQSAHKYFSDRERRFIHSLVQEATPQGLPQGLTPTDATDAILQAYRCCAPPLLFERSPEDTARLLRALNALVLGGLFPKAP